ncbi:MAG: ABC transporter ATP-binding protein/permease, partial [Oscillospiraceae bacterium]|nr:ABC transporter ATP-binding protein/permease [Oscillospiraceae bacterium]
IQRCTSDVEVIRTFVCNQLMEVLRTVFLIALYTGIMVVMNWRLALVPLAFIPITGLASGVFYGKISTRFQVADEAEGELTTCAQENLTGVRVVRAFGRERFEIDRFAQKNNRFSDLWVELGKVLSVYWGSGVVLVCLQIMAVIVAGSVAAVNGSITLGEFQVFVLYNSAMAWPVRSLGRVLSEMSKAGVSMDRVGYILKSAEEGDRPSAQSVKLGGDIVFDHVTFGYEGQEVLKDVSFTIPWGSTFAILGGTGSGKSTLVHLLDRLYDLKDGQGRVTIGGVDIRDIKREELRRQIGMVLQEPFLFSQTIRENIAATRPDATEEELRACAQVACVDEAIADLANGYETVVGERGVTLFGGQKQRVAIARMLLQ